MGGYIDETIDSDDTMHVAGIVAQHIEKIGPVKVNIDITGLGAGVYDRLRETGYQKIVQGVNFGSRAFAEKKYANKRAEMWAELRDWLADEAGADIPDDDALHTG